MALSTLHQPTQLLSTAGVVDLFATTLADAVEVEVPPPPRRQRKRGWCDPAETSAAFKVAWTAREDARRLLRAHPQDRIAWKTLRTACANLGRGVHAYFEEYLAETERLLRIEQRSTRVLEAPEVYGRVRTEKREERAGHQGRVWHAVTGCSANS